MQTGSSVVVVISFFGAECSDCCWHLPPWAVTSLEQAIEISATHTTYPCQARGSYHQLYYIPTTLAAWLPPPPPPLPHTLLTYHSHPPQLLMAQSKCSQHPTTRTIPPLLAMGMGMGSQPRRPVGWRQDQLRLQEVLVVGNSSLRSHKDSQRDYTCPISHFGLGSPTFGNCSM